MNTKQLCRIPSQSVVGGVAAGVADYFGIDKALMRVIFVVLLIFGKGFPMFILYVILWVALPKGESALSTSDYQPVSRSFSNSKSAEWIGYALLIVGGLMFFDKLFYWINFDRYIPAAIFIGAGLFFILRQNHRHDDVMTTNDNSATYSVDTDNTPPTVIDETNSNL